MTVTITPAAASGAGALSGFRLSCPCGLSWGVSLPTIASSEAHAHEAWHTRSGR
jgi:hypothetical protein